jgi:hypothetical protein
VNKKDPTSNKTSLPPAHPTRRAHGGVARKGVAADTRQRVSPACGDHTPFTCMEYGQNGNKAIAERGDLLLLNPQNWSASDG